MRYDWVLFDADDTIFHFDAFTGLQQLFKRYNVNFTAQNYAEFKAVNLPLWQQYHQGEISASQLQTARFQAWADKLSVPAQQLNDEFLLVMAQVCQLLPGALDMLEQLSGKVKMAIITNGFAKLQQLRLDHHNVGHYFEFLVISELVGLTKPDPAIFAHSHQLMSQSIDKKRVLMVGDNLQTDIAGGNNYGFDTCWLQHQGVSQDVTISPSYTINSLTELTKIVIGE